MSAPDFAEQFRQLVDAFDAIPGVGPQAARRMGRYVLSHPGSRDLGESIVQARNSLNHCAQCRMFTTEVLCADCTAAETTTSEAVTDKTAAALFSGVLLVAEQADEALYWREQGYTGPVFVLHGVLSPVDGVGPTQLGLAQLKQRVAALQSQTLWLALQSDTAKGAGAEPSVEARATELFIRQMLPDKDVSLMNDNAITQAINDAIGETGCR